MPTLIGKLPNQVPVNGMLGTAAFVDLQQIPQYIQSSIGLTPIVTVNPSVVVNLDLLSVFTSQYDNYLIVGEGIKFAADDGVSFRVAVANAADTGSNYHNMSNVTGSTSSSSTSFAVTTAVIRSAGTGGTFCIDVRNVNATTQPKMIESQAVFNSTVAGPVYTYTSGACAHSGSILTGFRLYSSLGNNFAAQGKIRVFGYTNI